MNNESKRKLEAKILGLMSSMVITGGDMPYGLGNYKELREPRYKEKTDTGVFIIKYKTTYYHLSCNNGVEWLSKDKATRFYSYRVAKEKANKHGARVVKVG